MAGEWGTPLALPLLRSADIGRTEHPTRPLEAWARTQAVKPTWQVRTHRYSDMLCGSFYRHRASMGGMMDDQPRSQGESLDMDISAYLILETNCHCWTVMPNSEDVDMTSTSRWASSRHGSR